MGSYLRPHRLQDALSALTEASARPAVNAMDRLTVVAGGTDFYPAATSRQAWFQPSPRNILDLSAIDDLKGIAIDQDHIRIGALTTWSEIIAADLPPAFGALKQASRQVGGVQIQNRGTIAGNLCNASPAADGAPPLLALDAKVELASVVGTRRLALGAFLLGNRKTALGPDEIVTAIMVPRPAANERGVFLKLGARAYLVISIASVAVNVGLDERGCISAARIAVGACSVTPQRLAELEARLIGASVDEATRIVSVEHLASLSPIDDVRATAAYRWEAALTLVRRGIASFADLGKQAA